jgi:hypothetical protein
MDRKRLSGRDLWGKRFEEQFVNNVIYSIRGHGKGPILERSTILPVVQPNMLPHIKVLLPLPKGESESVRDVLLEFGLSYLPISIEKSYDARSPDPLALAVLNSEPSFEN